jgi:hypothetical protein
MPGTRARDRDMNDSYTPERREVAVPTFPEYKSRWKLARDLGVFELKLAVDGLKDLILAPLALAAVVADMVMPAESRGVFLRAVIRMGEGFERWLNLYGRKRREDARTVLDEGGSDLIVDYLESKTLDLHRGLKDRKKKSD